MTAAAGTPDAPPAELRFRRQVHLVGSVRELWRARELVRTLAERDLRSRYKQAVLGFGWAVVTPVLLMVVLTVFFKRVANVDTDPVPYALFSYVGLLPWTFFSSSMTNGGQSLVNNSSLLNKVYCPREVFPIGAIAVAAVDMAIAVGVLGILFAAYGYAPRGTAYWVPVLLLVQLSFTLGLTFFISGFLVYLRDLRQTLPMILQLGLFATPVAYGLEKFPESSLRVYSVLNPLVPVIDGYRRALLYGRAPRWDLLGPAAITAGLVLVAGYYALKRMETNFADVA